MKHFISVERIPYEGEPVTTELFINSSNGTFSGSIPVFIDAKYLNSMGTSLENFPYDPKDEYEYSLGGSDFFLIKAYKIDTRGQCALQINIDLGNDKPHEGIVTFSIPAEISAINSLGLLLKKMEAFNKSKFIWTPTTNEFYEDSSLEI